MGKKKKAEKASWGRADLTDLNDFDWAESQGLQRGMLEPEIEPVTWAQRVYFLWLTVVNAQEVLARANKVTISPAIDAARREGVSMGLPFRQVDSGARIREIVAIVKNIVTKMEGE